MSKITRNRCYPPEQQCSGCNHKMRSHDRNGCREMHCMCIIKNPTMRFILQNKTRLNYRSDKRGMMVLYG